MFVDTHCHLYRSYYEDLDDIIEQIKQSEIYRVINNGCDKNTNIEVIELINKYDLMYGAIGIHPESANEYTQDDLDFVEENIKNNKIVAIGEIGLDYYWVKDNKDKQKELFEYQLKLAEKYNIPVIVHSREATQDTIDILKKYNVKGIIHSFSGSYEVAQIYIKMGFLLGINGVVTFKNCNLKDVIERIDVSNIVLETDSPYLTPVPNRGKRNDPTKVMDIAKFIADIKGISLIQLSEAINGNLDKLFDF